MYFQNLSAVRVRTKDGFEDLTNSVFRNMFSSYENLIMEHSDPPYDIIIPDTTTDTIKHVVNLLTTGFTITSHQDKIKDIQDTFIMLSITSLETNLVIKKYQCREDSITG